MAPRYKDRLQRPPWHKLYHTKRWERVRRMFLSTHRLCEFCDEHGALVIADVVDHKQPHHGDPTLFWSESNMRALCKPCHDGIKQQIEKRGYESTIGTDGFPVSADHPFNQLSERE